MVGAEAGGRGGDRRLVTGALSALSAAYLPLVPQAPDASVLVTPLWVCAKLGVWAEDLAVVILRRLTEADPDADADADAAGGAAATSGLLKRATSQSHASIWWSLSRAPASVTEKAAAFLEESAACLQRMPPKQLVAQDCSNVLLACARLQWYGNPALVHHLTACLATMQSAKCQEIANAVYSLGKLAEDCGHKPREEDLRGLTEQVIARLEGRVAEQRPARRAGEGQQQQLHQHQQHQPVGGPRSGGSGFNGQELCNMLLGCAKLGHGPPALLRPLAATAGHGALRFSSQDLGLSLYALAKLGCTDEAHSSATELLWAAVLGRLQDAPHSFKPQELSNLVLALEGLRPAGLTAQVAAALAAECQRRRFAGFRTQEISNSLWGLAKADWAKDQGFFGAAVDAALRPGVMEAANLQERSNLLYGLALVRHRPREGLLRAIAAGGQRGSLTALRERATSQDCANNLWALAVLGLYEQALVDAMAARLGELLQRDGGRIPGQELTSSLWALAVMGPELLAGRHAGLVRSLLREARQRWDAAEVRTCGVEHNGPPREAPFSRRGLAQLWQVQQELEHARSDGGGSGDAAGLAEILLHAGSGSLAAEMRRVTEEDRLVGNMGTSSLQMQVAKTLAGLVAPPPAEGAPGCGEGGGVGRGSGSGVRHGDGGGGQSADRVAFAGVVFSASVRSEYVVEALCCRVDVLVELAGGRRVVVEVDGPDHFMANPPYCRTRDGATQLRDRQLAYVFGPGNVLSVPYWAWSELRTKAKRREYLRGLLGL